MKQVIENKMYDTEKAQELGTYWNGSSRGDFKYVRETLYKTKKGTYFLYGEGGAHSIYAISVGSSCCGGEEIQPMSETDAFEWAQTKLSGEEVQQHFSSLIEEA
ncbi:MAG: hypothetical protein WCO97_06260 [bacterium]